MPVDRLLVEGSLDAEVLGQVLSGNPPIENASCSKDALCPKTRSERHRTDSNVCYLRDRDFDYEAPTDRSAPEVDQVDKQQGNAVLGWHWCRHEMENYLLDPAIVTRVLPVAQGDYESALTAAASQIAAYQASRWAVGTARRALPPHYELRTRPDEAGRHEFFLPNDMSETCSRAWAIDHTTAHRDRIGHCLSADSVSAVFAEKQAFFQEHVARSPAEALVWFSGKDLMLALLSFWQTQGLDGPNAFRRKARDWMYEHPEDTMSAIPEWQILVRILRT